MTKVILLKGLPGSGKSTWAKEYIKNNKGTIRVNKDLAREQFHFGKYSKMNEVFVVKARNKAIESALQLGLNVIVDDTNFSSTHENVVYNISQKYNAEYIVEFIDTGPETCKARNLRRHKKVPEGVIDSMYENAIEKGYKFEEVEDYTYIPDTTKPKAIIFDVDGTLATKGDRGQYDADKVHLDHPIIPTVFLLDMYKSAGYKIIVFTGRENKQDCGLLTLKWLENLDIIPDHFDIREENDFRCDSIVKREMFDKISGDYDIKAIFDDRDRVVAMWRNIGLLCYQVNYGNF